LTAPGRPSLPHRAMRSAARLISISIVLASAAFHPDRGSAEYAGHGAESVGPEQLAKYRPTPIPEELERRIQSMSDLRSPSAGRLSPDGKALYFNWSITGVTQAWKLDGPRRFPVQLTGGDDITFVSGMPPNGSRLIIQRDRKGEENPGLYLQDPNGGPLVLVQHLRGVQTSLQIVSDDSRWLYYRSNDKKKDSYALYRVDLSDPKLAKELVLDRDGIWVVEDIRPDGALLLAKETGSISREIYEYDPAKKDLAPLFGQGEMEEYDVHYGSHPGEVLVRTNKLGEFRRLYAWTKAKGLEPIGETLKFDISGYSVDRKRTRVLYEVNENGYTRLRALDAKGYKPIELPKLPDADHVFPGATTPDGRFTTLSIDDGLHPLQAFVLDWKTKKLERWHAPSTPEIDTTRFVRAALEHYPARDGVEIPVLVRRPKQCASDPCPVIMTFHGGPEGQAVPGFSSSAQLYVERGFVFVEPNVRGSDGYGKTWFHADDGPKRLEVITDIEDAAAWAKKTFASNGRAPKIGVLGISYGGYSALIGMSRFAGSYDAGVDVVGISNLITFLRNTAPYRRILRVTEYGDPDKDADALKKLSPMTYLDRVKSPLMIVAGASDPRVPAGESIQIHEALKARGVPTELVIFPDEGHGAQKRGNRVLQTGYAIAFFEKHLLGR
jgi:dipeptidyl aminopeptidase/acylaminoacyl peptidase